MLIVTHIHVFISHQVNDPRRSHHRRRCGRPAMHQSGGADERNSSDSLEDRNAGAQLNDSFQFNRATKRLCSRLTALWRYINFVLLLLLLPW